MSGKEIESLTWTRFQSHQLELSPDAFGAVCEVRELLGLTDESTLSETVEAMALHCLKLISVVPQ